MTAKAMGGGIGFREALEMRLQVMQPTRQAVEEYVANNPPKLSPGIKELVVALRGAGKTVYLAGAYTRLLLG
jgi:phosphoserine phosphatase